jgi:hypothetical protein
MPQPTPLELGTLYQSLDGVLANRLEQTKTRRACNLLTDDQRLVHQPPEQVHDGVVGIDEGVLAADRLGCLQGPPARKDRQTSIHHLLGRRQEVVAPVERRSQGPLASGSRAVPHRQ